MMSGGGTGGHVHPLLSLARELRRSAQGPELIYVGSRNEKFFNKKDASLFSKTYKINAGKWRRWPLSPKTLLLNIRDIFLVTGGFVQSLKIIWSEKPDVFFSKGGFVAVPAGLAALVFRVPIVTHDSDSVPGLANRLIGRWAIYNATGMPTGLYPYDKSKMVYTGIPIDDRFLSDGVGNNKKLQQLDSSNVEFRLLVLGGSLGAEAINQILPEIAKELFEQYPNLSITHIAGSKHEAKTKASYRSALPKDLLNRVNVVGFSQNLVDLLSVADLVLSRAGATTMAELAVAKKAAILVPSPYLAANHQIKNAAWLADRGAVVIINNSDSAGQWLRIISRLISDKHELRQLSQKLGSLAKPNAGAELAKLVLKAAGSF